MIKFSELIKQTAARSFDYAGSQINVEVFTQKLTPTTRADWQKALEDKSRDARCLMIATFLAKWDVLQDDDSPEPITDEFLQKCPDDFLNQLTELIEAVLFPNPPNASESESNLPSGSQPTTTQPAN